MGRRRGGGEVERTGADDEALGVGGAMAGFTYKSSGSRELAGGRAVMELTKESSGSKEYLDRKWRHFGQGSAKKPQGRGAGGSVARGKGRSESLNPGGDGEWALLVCGR